MSATASAPPLPPSPSVPDSAAWSRLLERLEAQRENLVDDFLERLERLDAYDPEDVPADDLRTTASETMDMLIRRIAGVPLTASQRELPRRLGVRRARQGVARESLLEAVRLDFRVLWSGLVRANDGASSDLIVMHAEELLTTVDEYVGDVQEAFLDEQAALARDSRIEISRAFSHLLNAGDKAAEVAAAVADRLGVPLEATFEVAVLPASPAAEIRARLETRGRAVIFWDFEDAVALVREQPAEGSWPHALPGVAGGLVRDVLGLRGIPSAVRSARSIARRVDSSIGRLCVEADVWPDIVRETTREVLPEIERVSAALGMLAPEERLRLLETLADYAGTGSVKQTALNLYCHRNTVVNRLASVRRWTGLDPMVPVDCARLLIAFGPEVTRAWGRA